MARDRQVVIRFTDDEHRRIDLHSGHYPVSTWMRSLVLDEIDRLDRERHEREQDRAQVMALGRGQG